MAIANAKMNEPFDFYSDRTNVEFQRSLCKESCHCLVLFLFPVVGVFVGWAMFLYGSLVASLTIISSSVVVFGSSLLLFVAYGNYTSLKSRMTWLDSVKDDNESDSRISGI